MRGSVAAGFHGRPWIGRLVAFGCLGSMVSAALAQPGPLAEDAAIARALGNGLHAFYGSDYQRAYDDLTEAVAAGSRDPRALYFRGLAARRMGRIDEAEADFSRAATMEAAGLGAWPVSRTLERVQGEDRLALERHRVRSRIAVLQGRREAAERRYSEIDSVQDSYLRRTRPKDAARDASSAFEDGNPAESIPPGRSTEPGDEEGLDERMPAGGAGDDAVNPPAAVDKVDSPFGDAAEAPSVDEADPAMTDEPAEREALPAEAEEPMEEDAVGDAAEKAEEEEMTDETPPADASGDVVDEA